MDIAYFNSLMTGIGLIAVSAGIIALVAGLFYFVFRFAGRVSNLERGHEAFEARIAQFTQETMQSVSMSGNPSEEGVFRRNELLAKLRANQITRTEAIELNDILVKEKKVAEDRKDAIALIAIILGLALLASVLAKR